MWWGIALANSTKAIVGLGNVTLAGDGEKRFYLYDSSSNKWERISNYPSAGINNRAIGFELNGQFYVKTTYSDHFYSYSVGSNYWNYVPTNVYSDLDMGIGFSMGGKAYLGLGETNAMWEYDPSR
ncbi:MAG: hypothetical protein JEZ14_11425 [Marinilabiliaceae bacterium]|nr:hypothetical protein [Marinilabiliaceae bacterium]